MSDPIEGMYGSLVLTGWVAEAPTGRDEAFLLLTTPDPRAPTTMPAVAAALGLTGPPGSSTAEPAVHVTIGPDGWITLATPGVQRFSHPGGEEWRTVARQTMRAVLVVGFAPKPPGMDADTYTDQLGDNAALGLVPVTG